MSLHDEDAPIHVFFELSYAQYLVLPRSVLQSMPVEWQRRFVACLEELDETIDWRPTEFEYVVKLRNPGGGILSASNDPLMDYERGRRRIEHRKSGTEPVKE